MNNKFTQWGQLFECKTLKGNQRVILGIILNLHNIEGWDFTPLSVLEERSGFTRPTIIKNLNVLVAKGLLNKLMNKSRQTNGIPPNDYVPIYDNIHNLLNSQRLKNFTFSQQEELKNFTTKRLKNFTKEEKKEKIEKKKEKEIYKEKEKRKSVTKDTSNLHVLPDNENNNKIKLNMSKQITKNPENGNTPNNLESFRPSENTNPSNLQTNNGNPSESSHCFSFSVSGCDNPNSLQIQASGRDNTKNGGNPNKAEMNKPNEAKPTTAGQNTNPKTAEYNHEAAGATETSHRGFNGAQVDNYTTHTKKTPQEANKWANQGNDTHSPMNGYISIDELEDIYNGGQTIPKPQSKAATPIQPTEEDVRYLTISKWNQTMRNIKTKVETDTKLNQSDLYALLEGSQDPMRVIDTLKTIKMLINNFIRLNCYWRFLDECEITIPTIRSDKQRKYAKDLLKECDKYYDQYRNMLKKII